MPVTPVYYTEATATGGRDGKAVVADSSLTFDLTTPKEMGGAGGDGANPEQLFAAGYSACFIGAMKFVAAQQKIALPNDVTCTAKVGIGGRSEGGFGLTVELSVSVPGFDKDAAQKLVDEAHEVCPYSNATRGNLEITPTVV